MLVFDDTSSDCLCLVLNVYCIALIEASGHLESLSLASGKNTFHG